MAQFMDTLDRPSLLGLFFIYVLKSASMIQESINAQPKGLLAAVMEE